MNIQDIYNLIGKRLWEIFPKEASSISYYTQIFKGYNEYSVDFLIGEEVKWFDFGECPEEPCKDIMGLIEKLNSSDFFHQKWTHCMVTLYSNGEFKINFSYIPEEDSWSNLYLRGISDLKEEELDEYYIPKEIWLDRVARKDEIYQIKKHAHGRENHPN